MWRYLFLCVPVFFALSCVRTTSQDTVYIIVEPRGTEKFLDLMASLVRDNGLSPHFGQVTYSSSLVLHTLEASDWSVTLWFRNVPLSGKEDPLACGYHEKPYPDPAQFFFYVEPRFAWSSAEKPDSVTAKIVSGLKSEGYDVRAEPAPYGLVALRRD